MFNFGLALRALISYQPSGANRNLRRQTHKDRGDTRMLGRITFIDEHTSKIKWGSVGIITGVLSIIVVIFGVIILLILHEFTELDILNIPLSKSDLVPIGSAFLAFNTIFTGIGLFCFFVSNLTMQKQTNILEHQVSEQRKINLSTSRIILEFHMTPFLKSSFFSLVYNYKDEIYDKIHKNRNFFEFTGHEIENGTEAHHRLHIRTKRNGGNVEFCRQKDCPGINEFYKQIYEACDVDISEKNKGERFYHIELFQGTDEEKNLDALLTFFNTIGYYYEIRLLKFEEIMHNFGFYVHIIGKRKVTRRYLKIMEKSFTWTSDGKQGFPYRHLMMLINEIEGDELKKIDTTNWPPGLRSIYEPFDLDSLPSNRVRAYDTAQAG